MLCSKGYRVSKDDPKVVDELVCALTVTPRDDFGGFGDDASFCVCRETANFLYIPKHFGLQRFGVPRSVRLSEPERIRLNFRGELMANQVAPVEAYMRAARDPLQMGGILQLPPGYGKTVIALYLAAELGVKTLVLVHKEFLMNQWIERIEAYLPGCRVGVLKQGSVKTVDRDIVVGSVQSVSMRDYDPSVFEGFGMVIVDECHHVGAGVFSRALPKVTFRYALGLSATVTRKDGLTCVFKWFLGDVVYRVARKTSVECRVLVERFVPERSEGLYGRELTLPNGKPNIARMINVLASCEERTLRIVDIVTSMLRETPTRSVIVLSDRRAHLEHMQTLLRKNDVDAGLYVGGMSNARLEESKTKPALLGTYSMVSEGFDLPRLDTLVLATPKSDVEQSVGRIQRKHCLTEDDNVPTVVDVVDNYSVFANQAIRRTRFYNKNKYVVSEHDKKIS
jgi:superfamily II DNA or RNA helicase